MDIPMGQEKNKTAFIAIAIGAAFVLIILGVSLIVQSCRVKNDAGGLTNSQVTSQVTSQSGTDGTRGPVVDISTNNAKVADMAKAAAKHVYLPSGNVTVATVQNPDDLRKQNPIFYQYANKGDIVLIYADRAILYNPNVDRVIDIIHIQPQSVAQPSADQTPTKKRK